MANINFGYVLYIVIFFMAIAIFIIIWSNLPSKKTVICGICRTRMKAMPWQVRKKEFSQKFICRNKNCRSEIVWREPLIPPTIDTTKK